MLSFQAENMAAGSETNFPFFSTTDLQNKKKSCLRTFKLVQHKQQKPSPARFSELRLNNYEVYIITNCQAITHPNK